MKRDLPVGKMGRRDAVAKPEKRTAGTTLFNVLNGHSRPSAMHTGIRGTALMLGDLLAFAVAALLATPVVLNAGETFSTSLVNSAQLSQLAAYSILSVAWLFWHGVIKQAYTRRKPYWTELWRIIVGILVFAILHAAIGGECQASCRL